MNNTMKNQACKVSPGTVITGKWHNHSYRIVRELGNGANGIVYLADYQHQQVAIKISDNSMSITSEVNVLKHFSQVQGSTLGPSLLDVDDWIRPGQIKPVPFYVMEYIKGETLLSFLDKRGREWTAVLCLQLLSDLDRLHQEGWVFGDLKPDNLMVTGHPPRIRCIDVGGTTLKGRAIKEFTEFFDRGYWGAGSRVAEPSYDLFAVAMILINSAIPKRFSKSGNTRGIDQLSQVVKTNPDLQKYEKVILNALGGHYKTAMDMRRDLVDATSSLNIKSRSDVNQRGTKPVHHQKITRAKRKKRSHIGGALETFLLLFIVLFGYILYLYGQL